jgi:hypothetical protein
MTVFWCQQRLPRHVAAANLCFVAGGSILKEEFKTGRCKTRQLPNGHTNNRRIGHSFLCCLKKAGHIDNECTARQERAILTKDGV